MSELIERARYYATVRHRRIDQRRKYTFQPYEQHLLAVAKTLADAGAGDDAIAAAWLHDLVEDTPATFDEVVSEFGENVAQLVRELTDVSCLSDGNRAARKAIDREHLANASDTAQQIKLADLIDNCQDICRHDSRFGRVYLGEMKALLSVIREQDSALFKRAERLHSQWTQKLGPSDVCLERLELERRQEPIFPLHARLTMRKTLAFIMRSYTALDIARPVKGATVDSEYQVVAETAPLTLVVSTLNYFDHCYLRKDNRITHEIGHDDLNSPIGKMWLFGIIILYEKSVTELIRARWRQEEWWAKLSGGRQEKTLKLQAERARRGEEVGLLECLQFSDKIRMMIGDKECMASLGFGTVSSAKRVTKELVALRDTLAHAQDLREEHWPQIVRLCRRITEILSLTGPRPV